MSYKWFSIANTNFENWPILGPPWPQFQAQNTNYDQKCHTNDFLLLIRIQSENLKPLWLKIKMLKIGPFWGPHGPNFWPKIQIMTKTIILIIFYGQYKYNLKISNLYHQRQIFWDFDHFGAPIAPKWGPKQKIWSNSFFGCHKVSTIWTFETSSLKTEGGVLFSNFGSIWAL